MIKEGNAKQKKFMQKVSRCQQPKKAYYFNKLKLTGWLENRHMSHCGAIAPKLWSVFTIGWNQR